MSEEGPLKDSVEKLLESCRGRVRPDDHPYFESEGQLSAGEKKGIEKNPLLQGRYAPIPYALDDLALTFMKSPETRALGRAIMLVCMHLVRYTDAKNRDVVVSNRSIQKRRGVGTSNTKAIINLLQRMKVLVKTEPSPERLRELQEALDFGFNEYRRYLVWNPQELWQIPKTQSELDSIINYWKKYTSKKERRK